ncbi:MAG: transcriptional regulator, partial [Gammaproteobacteria bacterium]|nr:transcriptional regulator [Gammaproteobacteria bacterium]
ALIQSAQIAGEVAAFITRHLISILGYEKHWLSFREGLQIGETRINRGPTVDTTIAALELAANGAGFALTHRIYLDAYLESGRLVIAVEREFPDEHFYFLCTPQRRPRIRSPVQLFRDWLTAAAATRA